jgi:hypothetical protein
VKQKVILALFMAITFGIFAPMQVNALGLKVAPLEYKTTLQEDERKQGFIDISNPSTQPVSVKTSVQAFKQINNQGGLQFFEDKHIEKGITLDLSKFELGPRQAVRMPFVIDGTNLPAGDVYAAVFFTTEPKKKTNGVGQLVRVGTLLSIVNKTPGQRSAELTKLQLPFVQLNENASGSYSIKNSSSAGGFYPEVSITSWPGGEDKKVQSSLLFSGHERSNDFTINTGYGIHLVEVSYGSSKKSAWVITAAPWMIMLLGVIIIIGLVELILIKKRRKLVRKTESKNK